MAIVGIDKLSLLDYEDKVSVVLFAQACNMRCPFCHNGAAVLGASKQDEIDFDEILAFLKTRTGLVDAVVFSGGEPTMLEDLKVKIKAVRDLGFLIKLDTNGTNPELLEELLLCNGPYCKSIVKSPPLGIKPLLFPAPVLRSLHHIVSSNLFVYGKV